MALIKTSTLQWQTLITAATTAATGFQADSEWMPVGAEATGRGWAEVQAIQGTGCTVYPVIQFTNDLVTPGTNIVGVMTAVTTNGVKNPNTAGHSTLTDADDYKYMRYGWVIYVSSGTGSARVAGIIQTYDQ